MAPNFARVRSSTADDDERGKPERSEDAMNEGSSDSGTVTGFPFCLRLIEVTILDPIVHRLMRLSITPLGLLLCYRVPMLLHLPLDLLTLYCPLTDYCGFRGSIFDYPVLAFISGASLFGTYFFVWREASRFWHPRAVHGLMTFFLVPFTKGINACLETRQLPNSNRSTDLTNNTTLLIVASGIYILVSFPFILLTDLFTVLYWPASAVSWNFISDFERCRSISFALFSAPVQFFSQLYLVLTFPDSITAKMAIATTALFATFNLVNSKHQADTIGNFAGFVKNIPRLISMKTFDKTEPPFPRVLRSRRHMDYSSAGAFTSDQAGGLARFLLTNKTLESLILSESNALAADSALAIGRALLAERQNNRERSVFKCFNDMDLNYITTDQTVYLTPDILRVPLFIMGEAALKIKYHEVSCLEGIPCITKPRADARRLELFEASGLVVLTILQLNVMLIDLDIGGNRITDACAPSIRDILTLCGALTNLDLSLNPLLTVKGVQVFTEALVKHRSLKTVRLVTILVDLSVVRTTKNLDFSVSTVYKDSLKRITERILALAKEHKLSARDLGYPPIEDFRGIIQRVISRNYRVARDFFRSLPENTQTLLVDRVVAQLGHPYAVEPGEKLDLKAELQDVRTNTNRPMWLYSTQLSTSVVTPVVAVVLAAAIAGGEVENIDLRGAMIGEDGLKAFFVALTGCKAVMNVDLAYNDLQEVSNQSVDLYADLLAKNESIKSLNFVGNGGFTVHTEHMTCGCFRGVLSVLGVTEVPPFSETGIPTVSDPRNGSRSTSASASVAGEGDSTTQVYDFFTGRSLLTNATLYGDVAAVEKLLLAGANPNAVDAYGNLPLQIAVEREMIDLVELLVSFGADPLRRTPQSADERQFSPLQLAAELKLHEIYSVLLESAASKHAADNPYADLFGSQNLRVAKFSGASEIIHGQACSRGWLFAIKQATSCRFYELSGFRRVEQDSLFILSFSVGAVFSCFIIRRSSRSCS
ncbi:hypothetical protein C9890_0641 [Perkinsus sp. BL_2016]|nr:hypothetical protein C9890_0641 [Perkinsus sp. BL_2016]